MRRFAPLMLLATAALSCAGQAAAAETGAVKGVIEISPLDAPAPKAGPIAARPAPAAEVKGAVVATAEPAASAKPAIAAPRVPTPTPAPAAALAPVAGVSRAAEAPVAALAKPVAPQPAPVAATYSVAPGESLRTVLTRWVQRDGWQLVWDASSTYEIRAGATFGPGLLDSVERLAHLVWRDHQGLRVEAWRGNRVIHVSEAN